MKIDLSLVRDIARYIVIRDSENQCHDEMEELKEKIENKIMFTTGKTRKQIKHLGINGLLFTKSCTEILNAIRDLNIKKRFT